MSQAATRQLRFGQQLHSPIAVAMRNTAVALTPDRIALLAIAHYGKWSPPALGNEAAPSPAYPQGRRAAPASQPDL